MNHQKIKETIEAESYLRSKESLERRVEVQEMIDSAVIKETDTDEAYAAVKADTEAMACATPFIDQNCGFRISDRDVVLMCGASGTGKSTLSGEITLSYLNHPKPILYISNEESSAEVLKRIAYFKLGWNPNTEYTMPSQPELLKEVMDSLKTKLHICAKDMQETESTFVPAQTAEGVHRLLNAAIGKYSAVIIDYYQEINVTVRNPKALPHEAQLVFDTRLDYYRHRMGCPIFIMAQSKPMHSGAIRSDFQNNRQIGNTKVFAKITACFEVQFLNRKKSKNSEAAELRTEMAEQMTSDGSPNITFLYIHKDRWRGKTRHALAFQFVRGRYRFVRDMVKEEMEMLE